MKSIAHVIVMLLPISLFAQDCTIDVLDNPVVETQEGDPRVKLRNISNPQLLVFKPADGLNARSAIVICPGGGYDYLSMENEGYNVANWLTKMGVTAVILKYRLPDGTFDEDGGFRSLVDAQRAIERVRANAAAWDVDPDKIGIMGFSAGGHLAASLSTHFTTSSRPNFSVLIYPVISLDERITHQGTKNNVLGNNENFRAEYSNELKVNSNTPPAFLLHSQDDRSVSVQNSIRYYRQLLDHNVGGELHILQYGGHGYGMAVGRNSVSHWPDILKAWLKRHSWAL